MPASKKSVKKSATKKAAKKKKKAATAKSGAKKAPKSAAKPAAKKAVKKKAPVKKKAAAEKKPTAPVTGVEPEDSGSTGAATGITGAQVNMGHVFGLRPRVPTTFKPEDFRQAKLHLAHESFDSIQDATRAVVERALEANHKGHETGGKRKRW